MTGWGNEHKDRNRGFVCVYNSYFDPFVSTKKRKSPVLVDSEVMLGGNGDGDASTCLSCSPEGR